jgi:hypothetical protein
MASLMTFIYGCKQIHHIFKELSSLVPLSNLIDSLNNDLIYDLASVSIDQDNPLVDDMSFRSELYFYSFQHFNRPNDVMNSLFRWLLPALLVHEDQVFHISLHLSSHIQTCHD